MYIPTRIELREMARDFMKKEDVNLFDNLVNCVTLEAHRGKHSCVYYTAGEHIPDMQLATLEDLGWTISWNSPCLWYEISWE